MEKITILHSRLVIPAIQFILPQDTLQSPAREGNQKVQNGELLAQFCWLDGKG
jgi:hypothetical protein